MKKRFFLFLLSFIIIYTINFFIPRLMPGDPFSYSSTVSGEADEGISPEQKEKLREYYGLDKPIGTQFLETVQKNLKGDFGQSIHYKKSVSDVLSERLPWTLYIMGTSMILSLIIGVFFALLGIMDKHLDSVLYSFFSIFTEIPSFLVGILLLFLIAARVEAIPLAGGLTAFAQYSSIWELIKDFLVHSILPISAMIIVTAPQFYFTARGSFVDISKRPYVLNARAKGLGKNKIRLDYILRNGIAPVIARFFLSTGGAVGGTILIENVFAYPGLGKVLREAVMYRDYVLVQGVFLLSTVIVLVSLLIADIINMYIKKGGAK